jgi:hypothetical protein
MKTCLRAKFEDGQVGELLDLSFVEDGHEFGPWPDGTIHIPGHGDLAIVRGRVTGREPSGAPAADGAEFSEALVREDDQDVRVVQLRRRTPEEAAAYLAAQNLPDDVRAVIAATLEL